jgi:hypothetical protein
MRDASALPKGGGMRLLLSTLAGVVLAATAAAGASAATITGGTMDVHPARIHLESDIGIQLPLVEDCDPANYDDPSEVPPECSEPTTMSYTVKRWRPALERWTVVYTRSHAPNGLLMFGPGPYFNGTDTVTLRHADFKGYRDSAAPCAGSASRAS